MGGIPVHIVFLAMCAALPFTSLCDFPGHQILKFDLYLLYSVRPALLIEDFPFLCGFSS